MTDNRATELESLSKLKMAGKLRFWRGVIEIPEDELHAICDEIQAEHEQAIAATMGGQRSTVEIAELLSEFEHECYMLRVEASETRAKDDVVRESYERIRDEFAGRIAATLVSDNEYEAKMDALLCRLTNGKWSKSHAYSLDFMVSCIDEEYEELYEKERAELGNGALTAEQVRECTHSVYMEGYSDGSVNRGAHIDETDWQAIADELNAALGDGECEYVIEDNMNETEGMGDVWFRCTNCNTTFDYYADDWLMKQNFCPHCGFGIRKAVKR